MKAPWAPVERARPRVTLRDRSDRTIFFVRWGRLVQSCGGGLCRFSRLCPVCVPCEPRPTAGSGHGRERRSDNAPDHDRAGGREAGVRGWVGRCSCYFI
eukprot:444660-Prymnesium_polylepis.1